ncbi:MFS transporter [Mycobacterium sp. KBS0706]|uniref:MFS transporter n=1 Tax=Mycobacterium sp. KBS0706 TaxID=2578109 RepID=UPI00110FF061|nr:MFS transporter [Mycobacterium sp. KBS0706]TSD90340.1 MFS transporter [Mycobacterium sp. KBS0706]
MSSRGSWLAILVIYAAGVAAAAQLGKLSALLPPMQRDLGLDLTTAALLVSLLEIGGATLGLFAGVVISRVGARRALLAGLLLLAAAAAGMAASSAVAGMFLWRIVEAVAYLAVAVAAPTLTIATASPAQRSTALALWSTFFPVGFATGSILAGLGVEVAPWRWVLLGSAALTALLLLPSWRLPTPPEAAPRRAGGARPTRAPLGAWLMAIGFACYTTFEVGLLAVMPAYFTGQRGVSASTAGLITGAAAFASVLGGLAAAWWMRRDRPLGGFTAFGIAVPALLLFAVFTPSQGSWLWPAAAATLLNAISGAVPAVVFARLPDAVGPDGDMATANGLLAQGGASGSLLGPPLLAAAASHFGWPAAAGAGLAASALCLALLALAQRGHSGVAAVSRR